MRMLVQTFGSPFLQLALVVLFCAGITLAQSPSPSPTPVVHKEVKRWFDIETLTAATRYRYIKTHGGDDMSAQQYQVVARWRFKFDSKGKYSVVGQLATGSNIASGWNNTGWGTGDPQGDFPVKLLYFEAKPIKPVEIQFGGIGPNNGESSEITGYDNDFYLMGERVRIKYPKKVFFDEISLTSAFEGDIAKPNVFRRFKRLGEWNYFQVLVRKELNKRVSFSADYTYDRSSDTLRQGVKINTPETKIADFVRFENYQRIDPNPGYGFALTAEKKATNKVNFIYGVSDINHILLNGDRYPRGTRVYFHTAYKITPELSVGPVIIQAIGPLEAPNLPRTRFEFIASYNVLGALRRFGVF